MLRVTSAGLLKQMALIKSDATNGLDGGTLNLFQNDITPTKDTVVGDLDVATFDGYAPKTLTTWGAAYLGPDGRVYTVAPSQQWNPTGAVTPNVIYGYWIEDKAGTLVMAGRFDDGPVPMNGVATALVLQPRFSIGG